MRFIDRRAAASRLFGPAWVLTLVLGTAGVAQAQDADGDGLTAEQEALLGTRPDAADTDGDGLSDGRELGVDGDADPASRTDPLRADTDGDGLADGAEDADRNGRVDDGETDPRVGDSDGGGTDDGQEVGDGTDGTDPDDDFDRADPDEDGLTTRIELMLGTSPDLADTDGDGLDDGVEDADGDGRVGADESHPLRADTDGGGTPDGAEVAAGADPLDPLDDPDADPDGDGLSTRAENALGTSGRDPDSDRDGLDDGVEADGPTDPLDPDSDDDGLRDGDEAPLGTDPVVADTDGGGTPDGVEVADGTDPLVAADDLGRDEDGDGLTAREEAALALDPTDADSDDDGVPDGQERGPGVDTDGDGLPNGRDWDSDDDGIADGTELGYDRPADGTDVGRGRFVPDADPSTVTDPLRADTDGGGVPDGAEDLDANGRVDPGETDPTDAADDGDPPEDSDGDGLADEAELMMGLDPSDADSDDDGLLDGDEPTPTADTDGDELIDALDPDADGDGLNDGLEAGVSERPEDSDPAVFVADADPSTTTDPRDPDSDGGGVSDGDEDVNGNGLREPAETDPRDANDDRPLPPDEDAEVDAGGAEDMEVADMAETDAEVDLGPPLPDIEGLYGGCDAQGGGPAAWWLLALGLLAARRRGLALLALLVGTLPTPAGAVEGDRFAPAIGAGGVGELESATVEGHLELRTGLWVRAAGATVTGAFADGSGDVELSGMAVRMDATVALDIADRVTVGLGVPAVLSQDGVDAERQAIETGGLGDLRVMLKVMLWRGPEGGPSVAIELPIGLPTGDPDRWLGTGGVTLTPSVLFDVPAGPVEVLTHVGYRVAPEETVFGTTFGDAIVLGAGVRYPLPDLPVDVGASVAGDLGTDFVAAQMPLEAHLMATWRFTRCLAATFGGGIALSGGIGAAPGRVLLGLTHRCSAPPPAPPKTVVVPPPPPPGPGDGDGDGIADDVDKCPAAAEDGDGYEDLDGCPDPDNDGDGVNDVEDPCPLEPEDRDGFEDVDGCPDKDNDGDGFPDAVDQCPNRAENRDGIQDDDGCPEERITRMGRAEVDGAFIFLSSPIEFVGATATLDPGSAVLIADLASLINRRPDWKAIEIGAHTSSDGAEQANMTLSTQRADAVRAALIQGGVDDGRLEAAGYGETLPIESNRTESGRKANERIEVRITDPAP